MPSKSPADSKVKKILASSEPGLLAAAPNCENYLQMLAKMDVMVGHFYLQLGHARVGNFLPRGVRAGQAKQCYKNAGSLALFDTGERFVYCEGYALRPGLIPVHHAWCIDAKGDVVDPTWPDDERTEYLGVALDPEVLSNHCQTAGVWGLFAEQLQHFVAERHPSTYLHPQWRPSQERMDAFFSRIQSVINTRSSGLPEPSENTKSSSKPFRTH